MSLQGYDVHVGLGRTAVNKLLACVEHLPLWVGSYAGQSESRNELGTVFHTEYQFSVSRPRIRAALEQPDTNTGPAPPASVRAVLDIAGSARVTIGAPERPPVISYSMSLDGEVAVAVGCDFVETDSGLRAVLAFPSCRVERLALKNAPDPDCVGSMMIHAAEFVLEGELRKRQQSIPLTGAIVARHPPFGAVERALLKSHYYRFESGDLVVGLALSFAPGATPDFAKAPLSIRPASSADLALSVDVDYFNRVLANVVSAMNRQNWRYGGSWDRLANEPNFLAFDEYPWERRIRSVVVSAGHDGILHATLHSGWQQTDMAVRLQLRPQVVNHHLQLKVEHTDFDLTGPSGVFIKIAVNVIYYGVKWIAQTLATRTVSRLLHDTEEYGSGIVVNHDIFNGMPEGMVVTSQLVDVQLTTDTLTAGYAIDCLPTT